MLEPISANQTHANYRLQPLLQRRLSAPPAFTCHRPPHRQPLSQRRLSAPPAFTCRRPSHRRLPAHCSGCCQRRFSHRLPHHLATARHTGDCPPVASAAVATAIVPQQSAPPVASAAVSAAFRTACHTILPLSATPAAACPSQRRSFRNNLPRPHCYMIGGTYILLRESGMLFFASSVKPRTIVGSADVGTPMNIMSSPKSVAARHP